MGAQPRFHPLAWCAWGGAALVVAQVLANPLTSALLIAVACVVVAAHARDRHGVRLFRMVLGLGVVFAGVRVVIAVLTTHGAIVDGGGGVWATLPSFTMPRWLGGYAVGGTVEQPVVLQALNDGLALLALFAVVGAFNAVVSHHQLVRSLPRAFHELGLVLTVAITFLPATLDAVAAAREADVARTGGVRVRRGRVRRVLVPVVEGGLERALNLAESMDARGFGSEPAERRTRTAGWLVLVAAIALIGTLVALVGRSQPMALALAGVAVVAVVAATVVASRATRRPRYRPRPLEPADRRLVAVSITVVTIAVLVSIDVLPGGDTMRWAANPFALPQVAPLLLLAIAGLAAPLATMASVTPARAEALAHAEAPT
jgi:energy-coupling factor transport system permease protein